MLNNAPLQTLSSGYYARLRRRQLHRATKKGGGKHAKQKSFKERYFPFHRLPREIIAEIFVLCLPDFEDDYSFTKSKSAAPILLCNVSSSWRSLALSIPRLWNELSIQITDPQLNISLAVAMLESWIARSGELPLSLRVHAAPWSKRGQAMGQAHLNTFFRYASRWESVDIRLSRVSFPKFGPTPFLSKFSYSTSWHDDIDRVPFPFTSCSLLSAFSWPFSCSTTSEPGIPWHQLTHITIKTSANTHEALDILRTCEMLVEFNVEIGGDRLNLDLVQPLRKSVENRSLRSFHICVHITCSALLQSLTLPALTDLLLDTYYDDLSSTSARSVHTELLGLFTRSRCKLEKLELQDCWFNDTCILNCFQHDSCSSLTQLKIVNDDYQPMFTDRVILALTIQELEVNVLLPKLSRLFLEACVSASPGLLGGMVLNRCLCGDKVDQLKSFTLLVGVLDDTDRRYFETAEKMGLDIDITTFG